MSPRLIRARDRAGFTLIELLVVIAIIAILAAILFPVFLKARQRAQISACLSNLKQCGISIMLYCDAHEGRFPVGRITDMNGQIMSSRSWPEGQCVGGQAGHLDGTLALYTPPQFRPLNKYIRSIEFFHCKNEQKQDCAGISNTTPWYRFGSSYNFNCTFHYPTQNDYFHTLVIPTGKSSLPEMYTGRRMGEIKRPSRMIAMGERGIHYWYGVSRDQSHPKPLATHPFLGHANDEPWTPVVFCDGHTKYVKMTPGCNGENWALAQKGWCSRAPNEGD